MGHSVLCVTQCCEEIFDDDDAAKFCGQGSGDGFVGEAAYAGKGATGDAGGASRYECGETTCCGAVSAYMGVAACGI